jgi:hypothetical protein
LFYPVVRHYAFAELDRQRFHTLFLDIYREYEEDTEFEISLGDVAVLPNLTPVCVAKLRRGLSE